jgi:hypothetical protein
VTRRRLGVVLGLSVALAAVLTATGTRLAASQTPSLVALRVSGPIPARDPFDSFWDRLRRVEVPLSAQQVVPPKSRGPLPFLRGQRWTVRVRAAHDGDRLYLLLEWPDSSPERSVAAVQDFTDAAAVQFPAVAGQGVPALCMGDPKGTVNIWQWKAAWQTLVERPDRGIRERYPNAVADLYPFHGEDLFYPGRAVGNPFSQTQRRSAVDNLVAGGFGSLTPAPLDSLTGWGDWRDGRWRVVFARPLQVAAPGSIDLRVGDRTDLAVAVWDGAARERDGMKSVGGFVALEVSDQPLPGGGRGMWLWLLLLLVPGYGLVAWARTRGGRS